MSLVISTARNVMVFMKDSGDHITGKTGLTLTITASKNGAAFASISPTVTERGDGWYSLALTSSHTDTAGDLALHITGTAADATDIVLEVVSYNLATQLPAAASVTNMNTVFNTDFAGNYTNNLWNVNVGSAGDVSWGNGAITAGTFASNAITAAKIASSALSSAKFAADAKAMLGVVDQGTAQSATSTTLVLQSAAAFADDAINGATIFIYSATLGAGQTAVIVDYTGSTDTATIEGWSGGVTPTGTILYTILGTAPATDALLEDIAAAVLNSESDDFDTSGTIGEAINTGGASPKILRQSLLRYELS